MVMHCYPNFNFQVIAVKGLEPLLRYISHPIPDVPVCSSVEPVVYGVGKGEMVDVFCDVVSNPQSYNFEV